MSDENASSLLSTPLPLTADACCALLNVSRETQDRLQAYIDLLEKWQSKINLVGPKTLADPWRRHILDSAQLRDYIPDHATRLIDVGTGAGLPGIILAILGVKDVRLIESDTRKCAFLREVIRVTDVPYQATVFEVRAESFSGPPADVVTARALAPLSKLIHLCVDKITTDGVMIFPKGQNAESELTEAQKDWKMKISTHESKSDPAGTIFRLSEVRKNGER